MTAKKPKEFTKEQLKAIDSLLTDLDELSNKPRRLYHALEELAMAFDIKGSIPGIRVAQDTYYAFMSEGEQYNELFRSLREYKIEEWEHQVNSELGESIERSENRINGAECFIKTHVQRLTERRF
jgi:hypothetical protein